MHTRALSFGTVPMHVHMHVHVHSPFAVDQVLRHELQCSCIAMYETMQRDVWLLTRTTQQPPTYQESRQTHQSQWPCGHASGPCPQRWMHGPCMHLVGWTARQLPRQCPARWARSPRRQEVCVHFYVLPSPAESAQLLEAPTCAHAWSRQSR
jgi:hypothetical protein